MKVVVVGLGVQGRKRCAVAGPDLVATVDPFVPGAQFKTVQEVPLSLFDAALVCVPDLEKIPILHYLLASKKHVLVEKPLIGKPAVLHELLALAKSGSLACYTAYNHRFEPHLARLKGLLSRMTLGSVFLARFFYGNGTARDVRNSPWRDQGDGVIPDLGSHLLDLGLFLFGRPKPRAQTWCLNRFENKAPDHVLFGFSGQPVLEMEATLLSWRNTFTLDVYGELGSAHVNCLCKWGPSTFTLRQRVLPSGRPLETLETLEQKDPTWQAEYEHFLELCQTGETNLENDLWIQDQLSPLGTCPKLSDL